MLRWQVNRARSVTLSSGGKSVNVAHALKRLGESPRVAGFAGGGTGNTMVSFLHEIGIAAGLRGGQAMPTAVRLGIACGSASAPMLTPGEEVHTLTLIHGRRDLAERRNKPWDEG